MIYNNILYISHLISNPDDLVAETMHGFVKIITE